MSSGDRFSTARRAHVFGHSALRERSGLEAFNSALIDARTEAAPATKSVLLIEEDPNDVLLMERALRDVLGTVRVTSVPTVTEARAHISRGELRPDLILAGVEPRLGDLTGFLRWLGDGSGLPALPVVLLLSLELLPGEPLQGDAGPCRRLLRPVGFDALVSALGRVLPQSRGSRS